LPLNLLSTLMRYEVGAHQGVVLTSEKARTELPVRRRFGAGDQRLVAGRHGDTSTPPAAGKQKPQQRLKEAGDTVTHVVSSLSSLMTTPPDRSHGRGGIALCSDPLTG
jgi:hypothetical protein